MDSEIVAQAAHATLDRSSLFLEAVRRLLETGVEF